MLSREEARRHHEITLLGMPMIHVQTRGDIERGKRGSDGDSDIMIRSPRMRFLALTFVQVSSGAGAWNRSCVVVCYRLCGTVLHSRIIIILSGYRSQ